MDTVSILLTAIFSSSMICVAALQLFGCLTAMKEGEPQWALAMFFAAVFLLTLALFDILTTITGGVTQ